MDKDVSELAFRYLDLDGDLKYCLKIAIAAVHYNRMHLKHNLCVL